MSEIVLIAQQVKVLGEGQWTVHEWGDGRRWRLAHEDCSDEFPTSADRHVSLSAAEIAQIDDDPGGLTIDGTTVRRWSPW